MAETAWPLLEVDQPDLLPLRHSHEANQVEAELKAVFMDLVANYVRERERNIHTLGVPHLGGQDQFERAVKQDGLALLRAGDQRAMRYLFKAWKARNPKRGLHILRLYLQLLWPNSWECNQQWQDKSAPYPTALSDTDGGNHYLTSRVRVKISAGITDGSDVAVVAPALRSVVPAKVLLNVVIEQGLNSEWVVASGAYGLVFQQFTVAFDRPEDPMAVASGGYLGAQIHTFTGTFQ